MRERDRDRDRDRDRESVGADCTYQQGVSKACKYFKEMDITIARLSPYSTDSFAISSYSSLCTARQVQGQGSVNKCPVIRPPLSSSIFKLHTPLQIIIDIRANPRTDTNHGASAPLHLLRLRLLLHLDGPTTVLELIGSADWSHLGRVPARPVLLLLLGRPDRSRAWRRGRTPSLRKGTERGGTWHNSPKSEHSWTSSPTPDPAPPAPPSAGTRTARTLG